MPLNRALAVSENATAMGILSDIPMVSGLGPLDTLYCGGHELPPVLLNDTRSRLGRESVRSMEWSLVVVGTGGAGLTRPPGRANAEVELALVRDRDGGGGPV